MSTKIGKLVYQCLNFIHFFAFPGVCITCRKPSNSQIDLCSNCESTLPFLRQACLQCGLPMPEESSLDYCGQCLTDPPSFSRCISPFLYEEPVSRLIFQFKSLHHLPAGKLLTIFLTDAVLTGYAQKNLPDRLIPVPLYPTRMRKRGFNQANFIARRLSSTLNTPLLSNVCQCIHASPEQKGLSAQQRRKNLRQSYAIHDPLKQLVGKRLALVDDVVTTMSTADTITQLLLEKGALSVDIWCFARTDRH